MRVGATCGKLGLCYLGVYVPCLGLEVIQARCVPLDLIVVRARCVLDTPLVGHAQREIFEAEIVRPLHRFAEPEVRARWMLAICYGYMALCVCL